MDNRLCIYVSHLTCTLTQMVKMLTETHLKNNQRTLFLINSSHTLIIIIDHGVLLLYIICMPLGHLLS